MFLVTLGLTIITCKLGAGQQYAYTDVDGLLGRDNWFRLNGTACADSARQSPIIIIPNEAHFDNRLGNLQLSASGAETLQNLTVSVTNTGKFLNVALNPLTNIRVSFGTDTSFRASSFHYHWGSATTPGSEHFINARQFPMELHLISYRDQIYNSLAEAVNGYDSLAVIGVFFEVIPDSHRPNTAGMDFYDRLVTIMDSLTLSTATAQTTTVDLTSLLPPQTNQYYRYPGSLTTPGCNDNVIWTVFSHTYKITESQYRAFYTKLRFNYDNNAIMQNNNRRPQSLNPPGRSLAYKRVVSSSFIVSAANKVGVDPFVALAVVFLSAMLSV